MDFMYLHSSTVVLFWEHKHVNWFDKIIIFVNILKYQINFVELHLFGHFNLHNGYGAYFTKQ